LVSSVDLPEGEYLDSCQFHADGQVALLLMKDHRARLCRFAAPTARLSPPLAEMQWIETAQLSSKGRHALLVDRSGIAKVVDIDSERPVGKPFKIDTASTSQQPEEEESSLWSGQRTSERTAFQISPDGSMLFLTRSPTNAVLALVGDNSATEIPLAHSNAIAWSGFSGDGKTLFAVTTRRQLFRWDLPTGTSKGPVMTLPDQIVDLSLSPTGQQLAAVREQSPGSEVLIWNPLSGQLQSRTSQEIFAFGGLELKWLNEHSLVWGPRRMLWSVRHQVPLLRDNEWGEPSGSFSPDGRWFVASDNESVQLTEVPLLSNPPPAWLPDLAEALAGFRLGDSSDLAPVSPVELIHLRDRLVATNSAEQCHLWLKWFFADRTERPPGPSSSPGPTAKGDGEPADPALARRRTASAWARRAISSLERGEGRLQFGGGTESPHTQLAQSLREAERAALADPGESTVWEARAAFWGRLQNRSEEKLMLDRALSLATNRFTLWLRKLECLAEADGNEDATLPLQNAYRLFPELPEKERRSSGFRLVAALRSLRRHAEAAELTAKLVKFPSRSSDLPVEALDLGASYTASFQEKWLPSDGPAEFLGIETGAVRLQGTVFDLRAAVRLSGDRHDSGGLPAQVLGIPVERRATSIHFLHGAFAVGSSFDKKPIGHYTVHYANGEQRDIPIREGIEIEDAYVSRGKLKAAWPSFTDPAKAMRDTRPKLYDLVWKNPLPQQVVTRIDFKASSSSRYSPINSAPFLVAITLAAE